MVKQITVIRHKSSGGAIDQKSVCKAWVNFKVDGGVITINDSFNVESVAYVGVGKFIVNFITNLGNAQYVLAGSAAGSVVNSATTVMALSDTGHGVPNDKTSDHCAIGITIYASAFVDVEEAHVMFFGA